MKLARRAGSTSARRAHDERSSCARRAHVECTSCTRRAGLMSWLSGHLNGVILQTFTMLLYERTASALRAHGERSTSARALYERTSCARRASSSSQLHHVNGVLNELIHSRRLFNALTPRWLTVGRVAYTVVRLITHDCTSGLSINTVTVDSTVVIDRTSASLE